jgi:hypothetical protein
VDPTNELELAIAITSIVSAATGQPVNLQSVSDSIKVGLSVTLPPGGTATLETKLGTSTICSRQLTSPAAALGSSRATLNVAPSADVQVIECQLNTSSFNTTTGATDFSNGPQSLTAEVFFRPTGATTGTQAQRATISQQLTLNNLSSFVVNVTNTPSPTQIPQVTQNGVVWRAGTLNVQVLPVVFSSAASDRIAQATVTLRGTGIDATGIDNTPANGLTVTFPTDKPPPEGVAAVSASDIRVTVTTLSASGAAGPGGQVATSYAVDNRAPDAAFSAPAWINSTHRFALTPPFFAGPEAANPDFSGVNRVTVQFYATTADGAETAVNSSQDLVATRDTSTYRLSAILTDALGNRRTKTAPNTSGVDYTAPGGFTFKIGANIVLDRQINPTTGSDYGVTFPTDAHSGVAGLRVTVTRALPGLTGSGTCLIGTFIPSSGACESRQFENENYPVSINQPGYQTFSATAADFAGNLTAPLTRTVLITNTPPTVSQTLPTTGGPFGGGAFTYQLNARDPVDLNEATPFQCFDFQGTAGCVPVTPRLTLGVWGPAAFDTSASRAVTIQNVIKSIERTLTSGAPERVANPPVGMLTRVTNQANLTANASTTFGAGLFASPGPSFATLGAQRLEVTLGNTRVGNGAAGAAPCPAGVSTALPISIRVAGTPPFPNPFQTVTVYFQDQGVGRVIAVNVPLVGTTAASFVEHEHVVAWTPTGVPAQTTNLTALGIAANGAAWLSRNTPLDILNCT